MRLLVSARFNVGLFILIGAACALGSVVRFDLYRSWWFLALLGLMTLDVALCKLRRPPPGGDPWEGLLSGSETEDGSSSLDRARDGLRKRPLYVVGDVPGGTDLAGGMVAAFAAEGWKLAPAAEAAGARAWVADRGFHQRWGSWLSHAAIVVIFAAAIGGRFLGFSEQVELVEGSTARLRNRPWTLALDRFTVEHYEKDGRPKLFASELRVLEGSRELGRKRVVVNDPLDIGGVRFYQSSWGASESFQAVKIACEGRELDLLPGVKSRVPGTRLSVTADKFLPDFSMVDGKAVSVSPDFRNPGLRVRVESPGKPGQVLWLLNSMEGSAFAEGPDGTLEMASPPPFEVLGVKPKLFSGIEVGYDPLYKVLLAGLGAWCCGLVLLFGVHRRRIWVVLSEQGPVKFEMAGWSMRGDHAFHAEFQRLAGRAKSVMAGEEL